MHTQLALAKLYAAGAVLGLAKVEYEEAAGVQAGMQSEPIGSGSSSAAADVPKTGAAAAAAAAVAAARGPAGAITAHAHPPMQQLPAAAQRVTPHPFSGVFRAAIHAHGILAPLLSLVVGLGPSSLPAEALPEGATAIAVDSISSFKEGNGSGSSSGEGEDTREGVQVGADAPALMAMQDGSSAGGWPQGDDAGVSIGRGQTGSSGGQTKQQGRHGASAVGDEEVEEGMEGPVLPRGLAQELPDGLEPGHAFFEACNEVGSLPWGSLMGGCVPERQQWACVFG